MGLFGRYGAQHYREDLQGVRAIGAILIMVYHIWLGRVSGGVDVFFVVSGFLMAGILLRQMASRQRIAPFDFWAKIIRRIAPCAYIVLLTTLLSALLVAPETYWARLVDETIAAALHLENLYLMKSSVDYLASQESATAVQQFWALSLQMQFYLILPLLFIGALFITRRTGSFTALPLVIGGVFALSFLYSLYITDKAPASAYFDPRARLWEFLAGVLLAIAAPSLHPKPGFANLLGVYGLAALVLCGIILQRESRFPGLPALLPVSAALSLIVAGLAERPPAANRLLTHPALVWLGGISFGIYLWHWPVLVFYREATGNSSVGVWPGIAIILSAVVLAALAAELVERPLRLAHYWRRTFRAYLLGVACLLPAAATSMGLKLHFSTLVTASNATVADADSVQLEVQTDASRMRYEQFLKAKAELPRAYPDGCHQRTARPDVNVCTYGNSGAKTVIALVGGSHAVQWLPALETIARELNLKLLSITKSHCPLGALEDAHLSCVQWNRQILDYLADVQPELVITNSTRAMADGIEEHVPAAYVEQWRALGKQGIKVIGIRDNPRFEQDVSHCVARHRANPLTCAKPREMALADQDPAGRLKETLANLETVDMTALLCSNHTCPTVSRNRLMYRDREHLTVDYVKHLTRPLWQKLALAAPEIFRAGSRTDAVTAARE